MISEKESRSVHMEGIYVSPDYRGRGLGKLLWQACIKVLKICTITLLKKPLFDQFKNINIYYLIDKESKSAILVKIQM